MNEKVYNYRITINTNTHPLGIILDYIANSLHINNYAVRKKCRKRELVYARQLYCYFATKWTTYSLDFIAQLIQKDHSTVIYSQKRIVDLLSIKDSITVDYLHMHEITINELLKKAS